MAPPKAAASVTDPDFPFLNSEEAKRLHQLQAKVDAGKIELVELYAICDRILNNAHRLVLKGPSRRKEAKLMSPRVAAL